MVEEEDSGAKLASIEVSPQDQDQETSNANRPTLPTSFADRYKSETLFNPTSFANRAVEQIENVGEVAKTSAHLAKKGIGFMTRNGQLKHATPVPPYSDVAELEYISSLHQCDDMQALKQDGSVSANEVSVFLNSRHGLVVEADTIRDVVLAGLTADKVEEDGDIGKSTKSKENDAQATLDLVELTSALIIPNLLRLRRERTKTLEETATSEKSCPKCRNEENAKAEDGDMKRGPGVNIFKDVLSLILMDATGSPEPKPLNQKLVRDILLCYDEEQLAQDDELLDQMVECASGPTSLLDTAGFVEALTRDVERNYCPEREDLISTNFQDVMLSSKEGLFCPLERDEEFAVATSTNERRLLHEETFGDKFVKAGEGIKQGCCNRNKRDADENGTGVLESDPKETKTYDYERRFTGTAIDYTVDNHRTRVFGIIVWFAFVVFYVAYLLFGATASYEAGTCSKENKDFVSTVACPFINGTVTALLLVAELILFGTPFVCLGSIGNGLEGRENVRQMVAGIGSFILFLFIPYFARIEVPYWWSTDVSNLYRIPALVSGLLVTGVQLFHLSMIFIRRKPAYQRFSTWYYSRGTVRYESKIKKAGLYKVDQMLANALKLHGESLELACNCGENNKSKRIRSQNRTPYGRALFEYSKLDGIKEEIGGFMYAFKRIWNGTLFTEDGIWISQRMVIGTVAQIAVCCVTPVIAYVALVVILQEIEKNYEEEAGYEIEIGETLATWVIVLGAIAGFTAAAYITLSFIPTIVSTTLKFRRGVIPSMRSREFLRYRFALDQVTLLFGGMFWGVVVSAAAIAVIVGTFVFLLAWEKSSSFFLALIGSYLGLGLVIGAKVIFLQVVRRQVNAAFYRKSVLASNIGTIAMECYSVAISIWFMVVRAIKALILGAMYIGRVDTPLFAEGVGMFGPIEVDNWPTVSRKEILIHEAHRHPYLETLGYLYLMQLRFKGERFATRQCSAWRLIFVTALMPWLHKFREMSRPEDDDERLIQFRKYDRRSVVDRNAPSARLLQQQLSAQSLWLEDIVDDDGMEKSEKAALIEAELERLQDALKALKED